MVSGGAEAAEPAGGSPAGPNFTGGRRATDPPEAALGLRPAARPHGGGRAAAAARRVAGPEAAGARPVAVARPPGAEARPSGAVRATSAASDTVAATTTAPRPQDQGTPAGASGVGGVTTTGAKPPWAHLPATTRSTATALVDGGSAPGRRCAAGKAPRGAGGKIVAMTPAVATGWIGRDGGAVRLAAPARTAAPPVATTTQAMGAALRRNTQARRRRARRS